MPKLTLHNLQTTTYSANGTWKCPPYVTCVIVTTSASGSSFNAISIPAASYSRQFDVTPGASYAIVRGSANVVVKWIGPPRINANA